MSCSVPDGGQRSLRPTRIRRCMRGGHAPHRSCASTQTVTSLATLGHAFHADLFGNRDQRPGAFAQFRPSVAACTEQAARNGTGATPAPPLRGTRHVFGPGGHPSCAYSVLSNGCDPDRRCSDSRRSCDLTTLHFIALTLNCNSTPTANVIWFAQRPLPIWLVHRTSTRLIFPRIRCEFSASEQCKRSTSGFGSKYAATSKPLPAYLAAALPRVESHRVRGKPSHGIAALPPKGSARAPW